MTRDLRRALKSSSPIRTLASAGVARLSVEKNVMQELRRHFGPESRFGIQYDAPAGEPILRSETVLDAPLVLDSRPLCSGGRAKVLMDGVLPGGTHFQFALETGDSEKLLRYAET